jgi:alpha-galactosidase
MIDSNLPGTRRAFLGQALQLGAGSLLAAAALEGCATPKSRPSRKNSPLISQLPAAPARVFVEDKHKRLNRAAGTGQRFTAAQVEIKLNPMAGGTAVSVICPTGELSRLVLRWENTFPADTLLLGDQWERSYGDLQWRFLQPERIMPWYFAAHHLGSGHTFMAGVKTQPSTLCFWTVDAAGISLWLDFRNGGSPCRPGHREIAAATIVSLGASAAETPLLALTRFCRVMCPAPRLPARPVAGNNNWYYTYGHNVDADATRRDAVLLAELAAGHPNRPYCVIDGGWTPGSAGPGGPWLQGDPKRFPDMPGLAADINKIGVRPGIWMRPTALTTVDNPARLRAGPCSTTEKPLDLTLPDNLTLIHNDVSRIRSWGYDLIKHDFSTCDIFGRWGFDMGAELTDPGWHFADQTLTNAEIILRLYRTLRSAAGDAVLLGCNTMGHLGAGLFELQRTGDDVSGHIWERTRRMGVNTLAFRLPQNGTFFTCDADCAAHTASTPWEFDRQYLDLVARSGTALFISVDPRTLQPEQKTAFQAALQTALSGGTPGGSAPLDWLYTTSPEEWRLGTDQITCHWEEPTGALPLRV